MNEWMASEPVQTKNEYGEPLWAYKVPLDSTVDRRVLAIGLAYARTPQEGCRHYSHAEIGRFTGLYQALASPGGDLWAYLKEPLEPEKNQYGDVAP